MTKIKIKDVYKFILKILPVTSEGDLLVDVKDGRKIILSAPKREGIIEKTAGILKTKATGIQIENKLRRQAEQRLKRCL